MNRLSKQIIYGILFVALITGAVLLGAYLIKLAEKQPVLPIDIIGQTKEIQITSWQEIKSSKNSLLSDYLIELYNPNDKKGAAKIKFALGDARKESYLLPLEKKFAIILAERKNLKESDLNIGEILWIDFSKQESADLSIKEKKYLARDEDAGGSSISAVAANKGKYDLGIVDISVVLYDFEKKPIAVLYTSLSALLSGQEQIFKVIWPNFVSENAGEVFIQASSNIMDFDNIRLK